MLVQRLSHRFPWIVGQVLAVFSRVLRQILKVQRFLRLQVVTMISLRLVTLSCLGSGPIKWIPNGRIIWFYSDAGGVAMTDLIWLSEAQMRRIEPYFPLSHGVPRVDDRKVISGIIFVIRNGLRWRDAPADYGPHKTIYNRFVRWSRLGVFSKIFAALASKGPRPERLMIDATHLKAHRTAASLLKKGLFPDVSGVLKAAWTPNFTRFATSLVARWWCCWAKAKWAISRARPWWSRPFRTQRCCWGIVAMTQTGSAMPWQHAA